LFGMRDPFDPTEPLARLIAVFQKDLAGVRFPGADADVLAQAAEGVRAAAAKLAHAESLVDAARAALREAEDELLHKGQRALAYARIYAEESPALVALLSEIVLPRGGESETGAAPSSSSVEPRRRGRPRKTPAATPLFSLPAASGDEPAPPA
jgi:hypothetical protein